MPPRKTPAPSPSQKSTLERSLSMLLRFRRFLRDVIGILLLAFSLMTLVALVLPGLSGGLLEMWANLLSWAFGMGCVFVAAALAGIGLALLLPQSDPPRRVPWVRIFALELMAITLLPLFTILGGGTPERALQGLDGGAVGWGLVELIFIFLKPLGLTSLFWPFLIYGFIFVLGIYVGLLRGSNLETMIQNRMAGEASKPHLDGDPIISVAPGPDTAAPLKPDKTGRKRNFIPPEFRKKFKVEPEEEKPAGPPPPRDDRLPPLELLNNEGSGRMDERAINESAGLIEKTLAEFGIPAKVVGFKTGPTVTQFAVEPGFLQKAATTEEEVERRKVRVAQISGLQRDLALALSAERLRIEAPVPGRPYLGIEVPNRRSSVVRLRPILESDAFYKVGSPLAIALGRDVSGQPIVTDLEGMPHLLIAGTTGSGKSVCIASLTLSLVANNTPDELRLVMIDPKMVELVRFNGLPHLLGKVETDIQRILGVLRWVVMEMDRRYKLLEEMRARNIAAYNRKASRRKNVEELPRIVIMLDELADLMMAVPDQTEPMLIRLAQLARATGIHLVVATQRPSTDVVTGLIKANFPARLSFAVASGVDSRVILDTSGAESLLGHGDMLFLPPDVASPIRAQGVWVTDTEVEKVITFWQQNHPPDETPPPWEQVLSDMEVTADRDDLVEKAIAYVRSSQRCSASLLQRHFHIGYPRAARLVDELEELGVVGPSQGGGRERDVLIDPEEDDEFDYEDDEEEE